MDAERIRKMIDILKTVQEKAKISGLSDKEKEDSKIVAWEAICGILGKDKDEYLKEFSESLTGNHYKHLLKDVNFWLGVDQGVAAIMTIIVKNLGLLDPEDSFLMLMTVSGASVMLNKLKN